MSLEKIERVIDRFLESNTPEVLAIKGTWGVGKTFLWKKHLKKAQSLNNIKLKKYSYVSLFGINSLDTFKYSIFEQKIDTTLIGEEPSLKTLSKNTKSLLTSLGQKSLSWIPWSILGMNITPAVESAAFLSLNQTLICIDDFERKGDDLQAKDILGLISILKEQKKCKIVLIFDDSSFCDKAKDDYKLYKEKVIDIELLFEPSSNECAELGLKNDDPSLSKLKEFIVLLKINNIRTIKKIERLALLIRDPLTKYEPEVLTQALRSIVLFTWSYNAQGRAEVPSLDFIKNISKCLYGIGEKKFSGVESTWQTTLIKYDFQTIDDFDVEISKTVERGYIDNEALIKQAEKINRKVIAARSKSSFDEAWVQYYSSLDNDEDEICNELCESFKKNTEFIEFQKLNETIRLFNNLGREERASDLLKHYIKTRTVEKLLSDLDEYDWRIQTDQKIIIETFSKIEEESKEHRTIKQVLEVISGASGWSREDADILATASVKDYYELFKSEKGLHIGKWVNTCLNFGRLAIPSEQDKRIERKATEALKQIAGESKINALRIRPFGIIIDDKKEE